ncbi:hypothetical protein [Chitinophaga sp. MD30]|uniref:hypothetical protein n=1 Tax=Chitinophaga sp. MD30 TaxID=2033437 RepID=UPI000BAFD770|nr:hypothetical protein [Chitinophaga sp. MD30]ASZ13733.1 hypothetical protein CK934_23640 [Chitinophaga sp. MD30]
MRYTYDANTTAEKKNEVQRKLVDELREIITLIYKTEHERQKDRFRPFETWRTWEESLKNSFKFETTDYIKGVFASLRGEMKNPRTVFRFCGLPGIGKTRLLFECFKEQIVDQIGDLTGKILYVDTKEQDDKQYAGTVKRLLHENEDKIIIVDNCTQNQHEDLAKLVTHPNSRLKLITVSSNPEERSQDFDDENKTRLIVLESTENKGTVRLILDRNFPDLENTEKEVVVDFSSGLPLVARLMLDNENRGKFQPGSLKSAHIVQRLLGQKYEDPEVRAVITACSLFNAIGFYDDLEEQADIIALQEDLCDFDFRNVNPEDVEELKKMRFKEICLSLSKQQLLERKGRTYVLRPSPLAVRLAEGWWRNCTLSKFQRILPHLTKGNLIESFCLQFRYLKHVDHAQIIVKNLCDCFFKYAEVLNTTVGSRLFRSFVYVNPVACAEALYTAFANCSIDELVQIKEGRRNLVWALENLCFRPETFRAGVRVLAAFATGENENLANNATNQFLQLFHIHLPGTAVDLRERFTIIQYCLRRDAAHERLAFKAISSAMKVDQFHRMGGAEDQGDAKTLQDYQPSRDEIKDYWWNCINVLIQYVQKGEEFEAIAADILIEHFYAFCTVGVGELILPAIELVISNEVIDRMEIRKKINFIIHSERVFQGEVLKKLKNILDNDLQPDGFADQLEMLVRQPGYEEYYPDKIQDERGIALNGKIDLLSKYFLSIPNEWSENIPHLITGNILEGYNFGMALAKNGSGEQLNKLLEDIRQQMRNADTTTLNYSVFIGIIANLRTQEQFNEQFQLLISDDHLKEIIFSIARNKELDFADFKLLIGLTEDKYFSTKLFAVFYYGWGLRHLSSEQVKDLLTRLNQIDDIGKVISLMILITWSHDKQDVWDIYSSFIKELIVENSSLFFQHLNHSMDVAYYGSAVVKLLKGTEDQQLAKFTMGLIVEQISKSENYYLIDNTIYKFLDVLQDEYFPILWETLIGIFQDVNRFGLAVWHLKDLVGSHHDALRTSEGLLFKGNPAKFEQIFEWCKDNQEAAAVLWIAELLPVFNNGRDHEIDWHPYAKDFIDTFGMNFKVLSSIDAKIGTYSWTGPIADKLESDKLLYEKLLNHPIPTVREWAQVSIDYLEKQIQYEKDKEIDGII